MACGGEKKRKGEGSGSYSRPPPYVPPYLDGKKLFSMYQSMVKEEGNKRNKKQDSRTAP